MPSDTDDRQPAAAATLAVAALLLVAGIGEPHAEEKSATASLFDPHLTMPGQASPTFTHPQAALPLPPSANDTGAVDTHAPATSRGDTSGSIEPRRRRGEARNATKLGSGRASWYQHPGRTASGETFRPDGLTAAHHTLPLGSRVRVVNQGNGRSVVLRITDRTNQRTQTKRPYVIDLSRGGARALGIAGLAQVALYKAD